MKTTRGVNHNGYFNIYFRRGGGILRGLAILSGMFVVFAMGCRTSASFIKTDIEKQDGLTGMLAYCWRVQKDNAASGGGNTKNCDPLLDEYLKQERLKVCIDARSKKEECFTAIYRGL